METTTAKVSSFIFRPLIRSGSPLQSMAKSLSSAGKPQCRTDFTAGRRVADLLGPRGIFDSAVHRAAPAIHRHGP
jgi:hypothetical protein